MNLIRLIFWCLILSVFQPSFAATILSVQKVDIAGAHGLVVISEDQFILADTFKSQDPEVSRLFKVSESKSSAISFEGMGLSGVTPISEGYLICDLHASRVFQTDKNFQIKKQWDVENPWVAKMDLNGYIHVLTFGGQFYSLQTKGQKTLLISDLDAPFDFEFTENDGEVWISEQGAQEGRVSLWKKGKNKKFARSLDSKYDWKNPEGLLFQSGILWVLDTELGELIQVNKNGAAEVALKDLGIPILIKALKENLIIYTNDYQGGPALLNILPK